VRQAAQKAAEEAPDNLCRDPAIARMEMDDLNLNHVANYGLRIIDVKHITTVVAPSNISETLVCYGVVELSDGANISGTITFRKNAAGDPIFTWASDF
jgi:hypothetical protein